MSARAGARLGVFLSGEAVGEIERRGPSRYRFAYSRSVLDRSEPGAIVLSASLPVQADDFAPARTAPFFEGLLPEGAVREAIARRFRLSEEDGFGFLEALGAECAGAVAVLSPGRMPAQPEEGHIRVLDREDLIHLVDELPRNPLGVDSRPEGVRLSLGGIQHKLVLTRLSQMQFGQPLEGAPSTCLLKPEFGQYEELVHNEAFCMRVATFVRLSVSTTEIIEIGSHPCLYVERFDRTRNARGQIIRLHQEDMCQAMGIMPAAKYEENGGPSVAGIVELLRRLRGPYMARDINDFVHAVLVNQLLGNSDAHGKNFALLYEPGSGVRLAPLSDIVSTAVYPEVTERMAMAIGGVEDPEQVGPAAWSRLAEECGFGGGIVPLVRKKAGWVLRAAENWRDLAAKQGWHGPVIDAIVDVCRRRVARLVEGD
jgi:serine/threonine-protein kinase HipA